MVRAVCRGFGRIGSFVGARLPPYRVAVDYHFRITAVAIAAPVYTGKSPWQVFDALRDQGGAYSALQDQLALRR